MPKHFGGLIFDIGGVVINYFDSGLTAENYSTYPFHTIPEMPDSFRVLKDLNTRFGGNSTGVFKATADATGNTIRWLLDHRFSRRTGIPQTRIKQMADSRDKSVFMSQSSETFYGTSLVIDNRLEVLSHFVGKGVPHLLLLQPVKEELEEQEKKTGALAHVHIVQTFIDIEVYMSHVT